MIKTNQKGISKVAGVILGLLILSAIVVSGIWILRKTPSTEKPTEEQSVVQDETANWKTYSNTELGFSIQYPPDWLAGVTAIDHGQRFYFRKERVGLPADSPYANPYLCDVCVIVYYQERNLQLENFELENSQPIVISGVSGKQGIEPGILNSYSIVLPKDGRIYVVSSELVEQPDETQLRAMRSFQFLK